MNGKINLRWRKSFSLWSDKTFYLSASEILYHNDFRPQYFKSSCVGPVQTGKVRARRTRQTVSKNTIMTFGPHDILTRSCVPPKQLNTLWSRRDKLWVRIQQKRKTNWLKAALLDHCEPEKWSSLKVNTVGGGQDETTSEDSKWQNECIARSLETEEMTLRVNRQECFVRGKLTIQNAGSTALVRICMFLCNYYVCIL